MTKTEEVKKKYRTSNEAKYRYEAKSLKRMSIVFHKVNDADVLEAIDNAPNKNGFVKECIREHINKTK